jgi:predicted HTH transcriptional regulator
LNEKERFARFSQKLDRVEFLNLLEHNTGEKDNLDFKLQFQDPHFIAKDILAFANSGGGAIIFGVGQDPQKNLSFIGLTKLEDKTDIKQKLNPYLPTTLDYDIEDYVYSNDLTWQTLANKQFQIIIIKNTPESIPFLSIKSHSSTIHNNRVYVRDSVRTIEASYEQLQKVINRRLDTNVSTTSEDSFTEHMNQLKLLYSFIAKNYRKPPMWSAHLVAMDLVVHGKLEPNPNYPKEDFEAFINKMIDRKKAIIESIIIKIS